MFKKVYVNLSYYNGKEIWPRIISERNEALFLYNNHFCLISKSQSVGFKKVLEETKSIFKMVDNVITEEIVNSHFKIDFIPKKIEFQLTNFLV